MEDKVQRIMDAWMDYIKITDLISEEVKGSDSRKVRDEGVSMRGNRLLLSEKLFVKLRGEYQHDPSNFTCSLAFPKISSIQGGKLTRFPLFAMNVASCIAGTYRADGWDLSDYEFQPSPNNLMQLCGLDEVDVNQLVTQEGIHVFLARHLGGPYPTLQEFMSTFTPLQHKVEAMPYLFPAAGGKFTYNLKQDLNEIRHRSGYWATPGHPAYEYLFGRPKPAVHDITYLGAFPSDHPPTESQVQVLKHSQRRLGNPVTAVQGPPGSGKTTLILSVIAQQMVERAVKIAEGGSDFSNLTVVTSTNNQAVTNVIEKLEAHYAEEPFWLVGGNRDLISKQGLPRLEEAIQRLKTGTVDRKRREALKSDILGLVTKLRNREKTYLEDRSRWEQAKAQLEELHRGLPELEARLRQSKAKVQRLENEVGPLAPYQQLPTDTYRAIAAYLDTAWLQLPAKDAARFLQLWYRLTGRSEGQILRTLGAKIVEMIARTASTPFPLSVPTDRGTLAETRQLIHERLRLVERYSATAHALDQARHTLSGVTDRVRAVEREMETLRERTQARPDDYYKTFHTKDHRDHILLFEKSREFLQTEALLRKDEVIPALELYSRVLQSREKWNAVRILETNPQRHLAAISLVFPVVTMALLSARNMFPLLAPELIDRIIVDEAGMIPLHQLFPLLVRGRSAIVVGDPMQIEPLALPEQTAKQFYQTGFRSRGLSGADWDMFSPAAVRTATAYHRAAGAGPDGPNLGNGIVLREHFRCQAPIAQYFDGICHYDLVVKTKKKDSKLGPSLIAYHVPGRMVGKVNMAEAEAVEAIVGHLLEMGYLTTHPKDEETLGVITPFRPQADEIERRLITRWPRFRGQKAVGTVHTFQGGEKSAIVLSTRACGGRDGINFFNDRPNILNVAVSRAKELFVLVGDLYNLKSAGGFAGRLVQHIEEYGVILEYSPGPPSLPSLPAVETIHDCHHLAILDQALAEAKHEFFLVCPWIRGKAASDFMDWAKPALERGVAVTVIYGYDEDKNQDQIMVERLKELFGRYPRARLHQAHGRGTHEKLLLWDDQGAVVGSWNWLSHWYTRACALQQIKPQVQVRRETSLRVTDPSVITDIRRSLVDMLREESNRLQEK